MVGGRYFASQECCKILSSGRLTLRSITPKSFRFIACRFHCFRLGSYFKRDLNQPLRDRGDPRSFCGLQRFRTLATQEQRKISFRDCVNHLNLSRQGTFTPEVQLPRISVNFGRTSCRRPNRGWMVRVFRPNIVNQAFEKSRGAMAKNTWNGIPQAT
jgi:hypothetical protein